MSSDHLLIIIMFGQIILVFLKTDKNVCLLAKNACVWHPYDSNDIILV